MPAGGAVGQGRQVGFDFDCGSVSPLLIWPWNPTTNPTTTNQSNKQTSDRNQTKGGCASTGSWLSTLI